MFLTLVPRLQCPRSGSTTKHGAPLKCHCHSFRNTSLAILITLKNWDRHEDDSAVLRFLQGGGRVGKCTSKVGILGAFSMKVFDFEHP